VPTSRAFSALLTAAESIEQERPGALEQALASVAASDLLNVAARHRCRGYLHRAILTHEIRTEPALAFVHASREERAKAVVQAYAARRQLSDVMALLQAAGVPFALLKGAARLFREDVEAGWNTMCDLDILIQPLHAATAANALQGAGYRSKALVPNRRRRPHHHLPPLIPQHPGLSVELHVALAPPDALTTATDWAACEPYFERVASHGVEATCLNDLGTAFHLLVHGTGVHRLHDLIMLARILRADPVHHDRLAALCAQERTAFITLPAALALSVRIAGLRVQAHRTAERYLRWAARREELPRFVRERSQFADAWYGNGGKPWGPATAAAFPRFDEPDRPAFVLPVVYAGRVLGRMATSAFALAYASAR